MRAHCSAWQSVASVDDVRTAKHGDPEISLVCKGVTPAHSATTNTFPLRRVNLIFLVSSLSKRRLILTTGRPLRFGLFVRLSSTTFFVAETITFSSRLSFFYGLLFAALFLSETVNFLHFQSFLLRSDCS
ncbi:hypothetical protein PF006_g31484 [Phytophthora fragariae]|uniref:Uncharacterized protein n=1 Tax=Phytophthora fragariae TaxID=53985 RepID=A0A6A3PIJ2_9STRA|nr:hypothetical protein PF011_g26313 [Phytophthora fragariae]KAE9061124.1 hypothetical protein PF006_g31484 [Phytophthora fragariae]